jgi:hypothetical protein
MEQDSLGSQYKEEKSSLFPFAGGRLLSHQPQGSRTRREQNKKEEEQDGSR